MQPSKTVQLSKTDLVIRHVELNPGLTNAEIAEALGFDSSWVAALTKQLVDNGRMRRELRPLKERNGGSQYLMYPMPRPKSVIDLESLQPVIDGLANQIAQQIASNVMERLKSELIGALANVNVDDLTREIGEKVQQRLHQPVATPPIAKEAEEVVYPSVTSIEPAAPKEGRPRKPKVVVCGLLPQQAGMIASEFSEFYDLSFWKEEGMAKLESMAKSADHVVTFSGKMGHAAENHARNASKNFTRVMGGMTELRRTLSNLGAAAR